MRILTIGDIHGKHEVLQNGIDKYSSGGYDKLVLIGDLADSWDRTDEDILRCFKIAFDVKEKDGDKVEWLWGNHDWQYLFGRMMCSGFRSNLCATLTPLLTENRQLLKMAYLEGKYLFTHAGVQNKWYKKYEKEILSTEGKNIAECLNIMKDMGKFHDMLYEIGARRGGRYDEYGSPLWCDRTEIESFNPIKGYHQIVGHTPQRFIERVEKFGGGSRYNNTSVTFCDVLDKQPDSFLTIDIAD